MIFEVDSVEMLDEEFNTIYKQIVKKQLLEKFAHLVPSDKGVKTKDPELNVELLEWKTQWKITSKKQNHEYHLLKPIQPE